MKKQKWVFVLVCLFGAGSLGTCLAQNRNVLPDTTAKTIRTTVKPDTSRGELVLDEINIQGRVEKPGVFIVPKRVEPELKEKELDRSFKKELHQGVGEIIKPQKELRRVDNVKSIKKVVERERKK